MKARAYRLVDGRNYVPCSVEEVTHIKLHMQGPFSHRMIPVITKGSRDDTGCWTWNGDVDKPTIKPSILTKSKRHITDEEADLIMSGEKIDLPDLVCHTWVNDGKVEFLKDCTHEFAGQTMDLLDVEE